MKQHITRTRVLLNTHPVMQHQSVFFALLVFAIIIPLTLFAGILELVPKNAALPQIAQQTSLPKCSYRKIACTNTDGTDCSSYVLTCPATLTNDAAIQQTDTSAPVGLLQTADCTKINGWAYNQDATGRIMEVTFYSDGPYGQGKYVGQIPANVAFDSNDVVELLGNHEFLLLTPLTLFDGQLHSIYAYASDASGSGIPTLLLGSPKMLTCQPKVIKRPFVPETSSGLIRP